MTSLFFYTKTNNVLTFLNWHSCWNYKKSIDLNSEYKVIIN